MDSGFCAEFRFSLSMVSVAVRIVYGGVPFVYNFVCVLVCLSEATVPELFVCMGLAFFQCVLCRCMCTSVRVCVRTE